MLLTAQKLPILQKGNTEYRSDWGLCINGWAFGQSLFVEQIRVPETITWRQHNLVIFLQRNNAHPIAQSFPWYHNPALHSHLLPLVHNSRWIPLQRIIFIGPDQRLQNRCFNFDRSNLHQFHLCDEISDSAHSLMVTVLDGSLFAGWVLHLPHNPGDILIEHKWHDEPFPEGRWTFHRIVLRE